MSLVKIYKNSLLLLSLISITINANLPIIADLPVLPEISSTLNSPSIAKVPLLQEMDFTGAGVLPYTQFPNDPTFYFILSREAYGQSAGLFDAFGGARDPGETPIETAARESAEEMIEILMTPQQAQKYLDPHENHTKIIIANTKKRAVTFITHYSALDIKKLEKNFYRKRRKVKEHKYREKDQLARVTWADLMNVVRQAPLRIPPKQIITVPARVLQSNGSFKTQDIPLRTYLIGVLRPFANEQPYTVGEHPKIAFY